MQNRNKGITLIALIITIIVMLILVGVVVTVVIQSNLLGTAKTAGDKYKTAYEDESNMSGVTINGKKYDSIEDYLEGKVKLPEGAGKRFSETKEYNDGTKTAWIPAGFTVSGIREETTIDGGLVIYDIPDEDLNDSTKVNWADPDTVKTKYNQFVWIPVKVNKTTEPLDTETNIAAFTRSEWTANAETGGERTGLDTKYTEPDATNDTDDKTGIANQIANLTKSIYKYGGFYIGRYEAGVKPKADGTSTPRTSSNSQTADCVVQQDKYPYNYIKWGNSMSNVSEGAVFVSNKLYNDKEEYGAKSMLCTGACWDSMLDFIKDEEHNVINSTSWGNYRDSETYKIYRGSIYRNSPWSWSPADVTNGTEITQNQNILLTTGATERNSAKNIYDVAGNCWEWTTESYSSSFRVNRGGVYNVSGFDYPACTRYVRSVDDSGSTISFRSTLYVSL